MHENEISQVFERWNKGVLESYLVEITRDILAYNDTDGIPMVDKIIDSARQKVSLLVSRGSNVRALVNGLQCS